MPQSLDPVDVKRKKLLFRAWHRGTREADLLLGRFAEQALPDMDDAQLDVFAALLNEQDPDIYDWLTGAQTPPPEFTALIAGALRPFYRMDDAS